MLVVAAVATAASQPSFHKFAPGAQRERGREGEREKERGAEDDGMTNGIWHAMHTADKGEGNRATVCPSSIWGNLPRTRRTSRRTLFREHRGDSASLGFSANNMQLKYSSSTVWKCVGEKDGMKRERKWEERAAAAGWTDDDSNAHTWRRWKQTWEGNTYQSGLMTKTQKGVGDTLSRPVSACFQLETID